MGGRTACAHVRLLHDDGNTHTVLFLKDGFISTRLVRGKKAHQMRLFDKMMGCLSISGSTHGNSRKIVVVSSFVGALDHSAGSDELGYGVTAGGALRAGLKRRNYQIVDTAELVDTSARTKLAFVHETYRVLSQIPMDDVDAVLVFHSFHQFPAEIRRIMCERKLPSMPIVGFTHGSHLDETDLWRTDHFPGMEVADVGNLACLDRVLVVSHYFRDLLTQRSRAFGSSISDRLASRMVVTGLCVDPSLIDPQRQAFRETKAGNPITVVFNHSATQAKAPERCFEVMRRIMAVAPVRLLVTRAFHPGAPGYRELQLLRTAYGARVVEGGTLSLPAYYQQLWLSDIQISCALHESFGVATLEAMYTGNCCLVPDRQSYPELTGGVGLYSDDLELETTLLRMIADPDARANIAHQQQTRSLQFLPDSMVDRVAAALEDVIAARPAMAG